MHNSTCDRNQIIENIQKSIAHKILLHTIFKNLENSHKYPQLIECNSFADDILYFTALMPEELLNTRWSIHVDQIMSCSMASQTAEQFKKGALAKTDLSCRT